MNKKIHFIGIGGIGMSAIAGILLEQGFQVTGSDLKKTKITENLEKLGAKIIYDHKKENLSDSVCEVVVSSAIQKDNSEYTKALNKGLKITQRAEKLAEVMNSKKALCVAGAHGKTTTTGMLFCLLREGKLKPSVMVGGVLNNISGNYMLDTGEYFVAEADESDQSFLMLSPYGSIITNIEDDHMENYGTMEKIINAFELFLSGNARKDLITLCIDNGNVRLMKDKIPEAITYSLQNKNADYYGDNISYQGIGIGGDLYNKGTFLGRLQLQIPGYHNLQNAIGAAALAIKLGVSIEDIKEAFIKFYGVNRRFQILLNKEHLKIIDDYAHHPSEIKATIKGAREAHKGEIIIIFQPHRYSRTFQLLKEFTESFTEADKVILLPVYSAGERDDHGVSTEDILKGMSLEDREKTVLLKDFKEAEDYIKSKILNKDNNQLIMTMGAGDVFTLGEKLAESEGV